MRGSASSRFICIHGHFYQPPRENPWTGSIERQESASPFHDWNERVTSECYAPNAAAKILGPAGEVKELLNNYSMMSFDFGPTLLSWMEEHSPSTYAAILHADQASGSRFSGHGSAMAQCYNHTIMPLADDRDRRTQVAWGMADFERRFGRVAEGMWLPETAADLPTLQSLADEGVKYTVLSPFQAVRARKASSDAWIDVRGGKVDTRRPYAVRLPSGGELSVFFYDGGMSHEIAFGRLLENGEAFYRALLNAFSEDGVPQLVSVATDGETYGHHRKFGEMALAYCLQKLKGDCGVRLTNYSEYLSMHHPEDSVEITEPSSWSCTHGVNRWSGGCKCGSPGTPGWSPEWRTVLRAAADELKGEVDSLFLEQGSALMPDPWKARDDYVSTFFPDSGRRIDEFLGRHVRRELGGQARKKALKLLDMEKFAQMMYTSCGWFFEDITRIESEQVIAYALKAAQMADEISGRNLEEIYLRTLRSCRTNDPSRPTGEIFITGLLAKLNGTAT